METEKVSDAAQFRDDPIVVDLRGEAEAAVISLRKTA